MTAIVHIDGNPATRAIVHVPARGVWWADVDLEGDPEIVGRVTLVLGELELSGTVLEQQSGVHGLQRRVRIVGGAGGWATQLTAKAYHSDAGVQVRAVVEDAAREAGEELGTVSPASARLGADYVRQAGPASRVLEDVIGGVPWWVDYEGRTQIGERSTSEADVEAYEVLEHDPRARLVTLAVDDLRSIGIGSIVTSRLEEPQTVRELEIVVDDVVRVKAWCGGDGSPLGRLTRLIESLVARSTDGKIFGCWRYRVSQMSGDRVELQAVRAAAGLPDILPISMWPGLAGVHAELAQGAEVLVEFVEGDRTMPIITGFVGKGGPGHTPQNTTIDITSTLKLGAGASQFVALANLVKARLDTIQARFDAHVHPVPAPVSANTTAPTVLIGALGDVAATKVKAQ